MDSLRGQLLIAEPALVDPNFRRTVVLVAEHTDEGALGVILNRPTDLRLGEAAPELGALLGGESLVHAGGPVAPEGAMVLCEFDDAEVAAMLVVGDVGFMPADEDPDRLATSIRRGRVFVGHAGWGPGQLEAELEADGWIVEEPARDEIFADRSEELWSTVLTRKGGRFALAARMPLDPSVN